MINGAHQPTWADSTFNAAGRAMAITTGHAADPAASSRQLATLHR
jgi:hypothetical protein